MPVTDKIIMPDGSSIFIWHIEESESALRKSFLKHQEGNDQVFELDSFKVARKRKQWLASRLLSYAVIPGFKGIYYDQFGAPHLEEDDSCVSYSHSYDKVALIMHPDHPVGIDIQRKDEKLKRIAPKFLNEAEDKQYKDSGFDLDYLHYLWSIKETIFKVHKHHLPFKDISTQKMPQTDQGTVDVRAERFDGPHDHIVHYHKLNGYYLAHSCYT